MFDIPIIGPLLDRMVDWILGFFFNPAQRALQESIAQLSALGPPSLDKWEAVRLEALAAAVSIAITISLIRAGWDMAHFKTKKSLISLLFFARVYLFGLLIVPAFVLISVGSFALSNALPDIDQDQLNFELTDLVGYEAAYAAFFTLFFFLIASFLWLEVVLIVEVGLAIAAVLSILYAISDWAPLKKLFSKALAVSILAAIIVPTVIAILTIVSLVMTIVDIETQGVSSVLGLRPLLALVGYGVAAYIPFKIVQWAEPRAQALVDKASLKVTGGTPGAQPAPPKSMSGAKGLAVAGVAAGATVAVARSGDEPSKFKSLVKGVADKALTAVQVAHPAAGTAAKAAAGAAGQKKPGTKKKGGDPT